MKMAEAVTHDMASPDWSRWRLFVCLGAVSLSKNISICDCTGARPQIDRETLLVNSLLVDNDDDDEDNNVNNQSF